MAKPKKSRVMGSACERRATNLDVSIGDPEAHRPSDWSRLVGEEMRRDAVLREQQRTNHARYGTQIHYRQCLDLDCDIGNGRPWHQFSPLPRIVDADHPESDG